MALRRFTDLAGREAWVDERGYVFTEGGKNPTYYTLDDWNKRQTKVWLVDKTANEIIKLEDKLANIPGVSLSQKELDAFLSKAIDQVTPYYNKKRTEIETGIKEGKIRAAEDILTDIRRIQEEIGTTLKKFDIDQAQTEEEFVNTLADITASKDEDIATKRYVWGERIKESKQKQVQTGMLTSGIGRKEIQDLSTRQTAEEEAIRRRAGAQETALQTGQKYDLERITLARQNIQQQRQRQLGTPEQEASTTSGLLGTLGVSGMGNLPSETELARQRAERNITVYRPEALTDIEEERSKGIESRKLTLQQEEIAARERREAAERQKIMTERAKKYAELSRYGY